MKITSAYLLFGLFCCSAGFCQSTEDYEHLKALVGQEKYNSVQAQNPGKLNKMAFLNRHGFHISETGEKDISQFPNALLVAKAIQSAPELTAAMITEGDLDLLGYQFSSSEDKFAYYRIGATSNLLVIHPLKEVFSKMNPINGQ